MRVLSIRRGNFHGVAYSADGRFLVSLNSRTQVRFWDLGTFTERLAFKLPERYRFGNFALSGPRLLVGESVWDLTPAWGYLRQPGAGGPPRPACMPIELEGGTGQLSPVLVAAPDGSVVGYVCRDYRPVHGAGVVW